MLRSTCQSGTDVIWVVLHEVHGELSGPHGELPGLRSARAPAQCRQLKTESLKSNSIVQRTMYGQSPLRSPTGAEAGDFIYSINSCYAVLFARCHHAT
jgi:hypothetical protein